MKRGMFFQYMNKEFSFVRTFYLLSHCPITCPCWAILQWFCIECTVFDLQIIYYIASLLCRAIKSRDRCSCETERWFVLVPVPSPTGKEPAFASVSFITLKFNKHLLKGKWLCQANILGCLKGCFVADVAIMFGSNFWWSRESQLRASAGRHRGSIG